MTAPVEYAVAVDAYLLEAPLSAEQVGALFRLPADLREQAFWRLVYDSGAPASAVLALDADRLDPDAHRGRPSGRSAVAAWAELAWGERRQGYASERLDAWPVRPQTGAPASDYYGRVAPAGVRR